MPATNNPSTPSSTAASTILCTETSSTFKSIVSGVGTADQIEIVEGFIAAIQALQVVPGAGGENPLMQVQSVHPERVVDVLAGAGPIPVDRDREIVNSQLSHEQS